MRELALFAGAGGGILGGQLLGWRTVCAVEIDPFCREVLLRRQMDGCIPCFPVWDDVRTFDGRPWRGKVDIVSGGFPCQDISCAGKGAGIEGARSGLWFEMARVVREIRPQFVFVENSAMLTARGLGRVLSDLASMGFDARWGVFSACSIGAPHSRERLFCVAYPIGIRHQRGFPFGTPKMFSTYGIRNQNSSWYSIGRQPPTKSLMDGKTNGMAFRNDQLKAIGNGQVPPVAALAWEILAGYRPAKEEL